MEVTLYALSTHTSEQLFYNNKYPGWSPVLIRIWRHLYNIVPQKTGVNLSGTAS